jgi:hypothetical protein
MFRFWWYPTPGNSIVTLASDNGFQGKLQYGTNPSGRQGQYIDIPDSVPNGWGATIITSYPGYVPMQMRGVLLLVDGLASINIDDVTLTQTSTPIPPPIGKDMIDISGAVVNSSPVDIANWPITALITGLSVNSADGWAFGFNIILPDSWKWYTGNPHNPTDNYQYTVWPVVKVDGKWQIAGIVQMWQGRPNTGAFEFPTWSEDFHKNWCYSPSFWGAMFIYLPKPGDEM